MTHFEYSQNNSGGKWATGMPQVLVVEAATVEEADAIAISKGVYFDGVEKGLDCGCCGDRWYKGVELSFPMDWSKDLILNDVHEYASNLEEKYAKSVLVVDNS